jgi:hypothetical protein
VCRHQLKLTSRLRRKKGASKRRKRKEEELLETTRHSTHALEGSNLFKTHPNEDEKNGQAFHSQACQIPHGEAKFSDFRSLWGGIRMYPSY